MNFCGIFDRGFFLGSDSEPIFPKGEVEGPSTLKTIYRPTKKGHSSVNKFPQIPLQVLYVPGCTLWNLKIHPNWKGNSSETHLNHPRFLDLLRWLDKKITKVSSMVIFIP